MTTKWGGGGFLEGTAAPAPPMVVSLDGGDGDGDEDDAFALKLCDDDGGELAGLVGGKAANLVKLRRLLPDELSGKIPRGYALTTRFFEGWIDQVVKSDPHKAAVEAATVATVKTATASELKRLCDGVKEYCRTELTLGDEQSNALEELRAKMVGGGAGKPASSNLWAVRSSAPVEDGSEASYAGAFETALGVDVATSGNDDEDKLLEAVRDVCFASLFDRKVLSYAGGDTGVSGSNRPVAFAALIMEMVDAEVAGVAFGANPLNSDLDEVVVDCSYGLGSSVVDGSVEADRYVCDKIKNEVVEFTVGEKKVEKRLMNGGAGAGGVRALEVDEDRRNRRALLDEQLRRVRDLVCQVEKTLGGTPVDVEFAFAAAGELKLLQARPITTNYALDDGMITDPGDPRVLYFDYNVASEATTTEPFTYLDTEVYSRMSSIISGLSDEVDLFPRNPKALLFRGSTRTYANMSAAFRWFGPKQFSGWTRMLDPYIADVFESSDCDREKYRACRSPKEITFRNAVWLLREFNLMKHYRNSKKYSKRPPEAKEEYLAIARECRAKIEEIRCRGVSREKGLRAYMRELIDAYMPCMNEEVAVLFFVVLPTFQKIDKKRREGKTEELRQEYEALCGGYEGDPLMEVNIAMHRLARSLPASIWSEYDHSSYDKLADRIRANLDGTRSDIPAEFLAGWKSFMEKFGYDGMPQLFVSAPRYVDNPDILLRVISHNVGDGVEDPEATQERAVQRRRDVVARREAEAAKRRWWNSCGSSEARKLNATLEHLMWIRNAPKMNLSHIVGMIREAVLSIEVDLLKNKRLERPGDVFFLDVDEIDAAIMETASPSSPLLGVDLMNLVRPRRAIYERAKKATQCPVLIDSRNRILRPDAWKVKADGEPGTLVGAAISPGVATGRARFVHDPTDVFKAGEVLVAVVTDPAWTPLFVGAAAVVLQIGGVLQHGALCAREYGKPGVSRIDVLSHLKTGMLVTVDGNTGVVKILEEDEGSR